MMKKKCKKIIVFCLVTMLSSILIFFSTNFIVDAQDNSNSDVAEKDAIEQFNELYNQDIIKYQMDELFSNVPEDSKELLRQNGINGIDPTSVMSLDFISVFKNIFSMIKSPLSKMSTTLFSLLGVLLIAAIIDALKHSFNSDKYSSVFEAVTVLSTSGVILGGVIGLVKEVTTKLISTNDFILSFIPVYSGIIVATGKPLTGITYNAVLFSAIQIITSICANILVPLIGVYLAVTVACSVGNTVNLTGMTQSINKFITWVIGLSMTIFIGLLSLQSMIAVSSDNVGIKATKFAISSLVPVVGSALGDALTSVYGALGILKSTVGAFGIITVAVSFLPILIDIFVMLLIINITTILADILAVTSVSTICKNVKNILGLLMGILLCFIVMVIISISLMILIGS